MDSTKTLHIAIDPSGAQTGGRVVSRTIDDISKSALSAKAQMKDLADAQQQAARSAQNSAVVIGQQQDALRAKFNPTFAVIQRYKQTQDEIRMAHRLGALSVNEMTSALSRERQAALSSIEAIKGYSAAMNSAATARRTLRGSVSGAGAGAGGAVRGGADQFGTANLAAQFQDIAVTSAMGMSPLQIALQQGTQLSAVLGPMGAAGAVRGLGAAFLSIVNPVSLVTLGLVAGTAALIQYFSTASSGAKDIDTVLANHAENIRALKGAYGEAAAGLKDYVAESKATLAANARENLDATLDLVRNAAQSELSEALNLPASSFAGNINVVNQFTKAINDLKISAKSGTPDLIAYRAALSEIAISDAASTSQKALANTLRAIEEDDLKAVMALPGMLKAVKVAAEESAGGLDRLKTIDLAQTTQGVTSLNTALQTVSQTAHGTASTVIDVAQQAANSQRQTLQGLQQSSSQLRTMKTELSDIQKALADAAKTPVSEVFGEGVSAQAAGSIEAAASSIRKVFAALNEGRITAQSAHESLELIRATMHQIGGDTASTNAWLDTLIKANLHVGNLESGVKSLSASIMGIPNRTISIGIQQYTVPSANGGKTGVNVYGGQADFNYQQYNVGGGKTVGVSAGNGNYSNYGGSRGYLVEQSDVQNMYIDKGYGGARAAGGPVVGGKQYLVGENGPELVTMGGSGNVTNANSTASILSGGRDTLSLIEDHLYSVMQELRIHTGYWETAESNASEMIACLQAIKSVQSTASYSSGGSSSGGGSSRSGGGYGSSSSGNRIDDPMSPYYFNARRANLFGSGAKYSPVADALLNGNVNALSGVSDPPNTMGAINKTGPMPSLLDRLKHQLGFATGGQIMPGEDQRVEFFKKNTERVIIVDDAKVSDGRGAGKQQQKAERPIQIINNFHGDVGDARSRQAMEDQFRRAVQQVARI